MKQSVDILTDIFDARARYDDVQSAMNEQVGRSLSLW